MLVPGYLDLEPIATGGFSVVYRAFQESFSRLVALKVIEVQVANPQAQATFWAECAATGRLTGHPNIVTVLDSGLTVDGRPYITVDFYERGSLADRLRSQGPLPVTDTLRIGVKIAGALETAHGAGILHRDVKPQNILVSQFDEPALADFGIAAFDAESAARVVGALTPVHAAPEVLAHQTATRASDVYSLGSTLYLLLAGRAPHEARPGESLDVLYRRVMTEPIGDIGRPDVPTMVTDVLRGALAPHPAQRYDSAVEFGLALRELQRRLGHARTDLLVPASAQAPRPGQDEVIALRQEAAARVLPDIEPLGAAAKPPLPPLPAAPDRIRIDLDASPAAPAFGAAPAYAAAGYVPASRPAATVAHPGSAVAPLVEPARGSRTGMWMAIAALVVAALAVAALVFVLRKDDHPGSSPKDAATTKEAAPDTMPTSISVKWQGDDLLISWKYPRAIGQEAFVAFDQPKHDAIDVGPNKTQVVPPVTAAELGVATGQPVCLKISVFYGSGAHARSGTSAETCSR